MSEQKLKTLNKQQSDFPMISPQQFDEFQVDDQQNNQNQQQDQKELQSNLSTNQQSLINDEIRDQSPIIDQQNNITGNDQNKNNPNLQYQASEINTELMSQQSPTPSKLIKDGQIPLEDNVSQQSRATTTKLSNFNFDESRSQTQAASIKKLNNIEMAKQQVKKEHEQIGYLQDNKMNQAQLQERERKKLAYLGVDQRIYSLKPKNFDNAEIIMQCNDLVKEFKIFGRDDTVKALNQINLNPGSEFYPIRKGEFVIIRGPSGCGKTTFLNLLGSIDMATGGKIELLGDVIDHKSSDEYLSNLRLEKIGFVFQTFNLLATMTAYENVELPMRVHGKLSEKEMRRRARNLLTRVGLQDRMDHLPSELSGGEQQRVAIARALGNSPKVLLLDEPTGDLDTRSTVEVMNLLLSINNFGYSQEDQTPATLVMVTHNPDIEMYADRILYFKDGNIVQQVMNEVQAPLQWEDYVNYLNSLN